MPPDALDTLRQVNAYLRSALLSLRPEERHCSTITPQNFLDLLTQLRRAAECLRCPTARSEATALVLQKELLEYRCSLEKLRRSLPDLHGRLLAEKARLEGAQAHVATAAAWAQASKTL